VECETNCSWILGGWKTQWHTTNQNGKRAENSVNGNGFFWRGESQKKNDFNKCHKFARQLYKGAGGSGKAKEMAFPQPPTPLPLSSLIIVCFAVGL